MSLIIRLTPTGRRGERKFRLVVAERRSRRDGDAVEVVGWYQKTEKGETKKINTERLTYWISKGAKPSPTVERIAK